VLGGEVEEHEQRLEVVDDPGDRLRPLRAELLGERVRRPHGVVAVLGVADLRQHPFGRGLLRLRQRGHDVGDLVHPATLRARLGPDVAQRRPEPQRPVPDGDHGGAHAPSAQVS
jgi:hypothetical protein